MRNLIVVLAVLALLALSSMACGSTGYCGDLAGDALGLACTIEDAGK